MTLEELQQRLADRGLSPGPVDGIWGPQTYQAVRLLLTCPAEKPSTVTAGQIEATAENLGVSGAHVRGLLEVEAGGAGFVGRQPVILVEPHRFSRATGHRFDATHPSISYPRWGMRPYPKMQFARYGQLLKMVSLVPEAGFASASYGLFQILGENFRKCGFEDSMSFAEAMAQSEDAQLIAFENFIVNAGIRDDLARCAPGDPASCEAFCRRYNGPSFAQHNYHFRLAKAIEAAA